jgi:hypothetical protein
MGVYQRGCGVGLSSSGFGDRSERIWRIVVTSKRGSLEIRRLCCCLGETNLPLANGILCIMRTTVLGLILLGIPSRGQETAHVHDASPASKESLSSANRFGSVQFDTSCRASVAGDFNSAVALLHSFEYDEAQVAFAKIIRKDPNCAVARWGESMAYFHGIWNAFNASKGATAAAEARRLAAENSQTTEREKAYIAAISEVFSEEAIKRSQRSDNTPDALGYSQPSSEAETKYTQRMAELHTQSPKRQRGCHLLRPRVGCRRPAQRQNPC